MNSLRGRRYVVTGGGSGIGRATAERLAAEGARVAVWDIREDAAREVVGRLECVPYRCDVADPRSVEEATARTIADFGGVNGLVNAAGIFRAEGSVEACPPDMWNVIIRTNLTSVFLTTRMLLPHLRRSDGPSIVNVASVYGMRGYVDECAYDASKGGVVNLTRQLAIQYARYGLRVNAVAPGEIETPMMQAQVKSGERFEDVKARIASTIPMKRIGKPEEVAAVITFLLSDDASYMTGAILEIDGGLLAG